MIPSFSRVALIASFIFTILIFAHSRQVVEQVIGYDQGLKMSNTEWSSKYAGWHARTTQLPDSASYEPKRSALLLAVLRNTPVEPEGFTLALFQKDDGAKEGVAIDAMGRVVEVTADDLDGMLTLARQVNELPDTGRFRNTWVLKRPTTSQPIDRLLVKESGNDDEAKLKETSVQGFSKSMTTELKNPVGDDSITHLPPPLFELTGLVLEGREDFVLGGEDKQIVSKVKNILGNVL